MNGREIALNILMDVKEKGSFSNFAINKHMKKQKDTRDENLIRELVYGVLENRIYIDYIISQASNISIKKIHPRTLEILRMGVYQIVFMEKIPDRATINEAVNLSKKRSHKGVSGYVNGVLRNIARNKGKFMTISNKDEIDYLSIKYSHPQWMIKRWIKEYGYEFTEELCKYNNTKPKLNIRVNTIKTSKDEIISILTEYGYIVNETKYAKDGLVIENPVRITETREFKSGYFFIQDESSMLVAQILNPTEDRIVLDLCSAPGGKATHIAQIMNNKGIIISRDIYNHKLKLIKENAERLGITIIKTQQHNALELDADWIGRVDYCIIDAPCSGLGIIRRRPEIKWNRTEEDAIDLVEIQSAILEKAKYYVKAGGIIIYSTCTIGHKENNDIIEKFINNNPEFKLIGFNDLICSGEQADTTKDGYIQLFPHVHRTDGFFIAKMQKKNR